MAYERLSDSLFEKYSSKNEEKGKTKSGKSKKQKKQVVADYQQLPRDVSPKPLKKAKGEEELEEGYPKAIFVRIAGMNYRFKVDSKLEEAKTTYVAKLANDLLNETLAENPMLPTNQALILAYMEAIFRWQNLLHQTEEDRPKEAPLLPLEQYCKENNIPMEEL